jgi:hypothetical protein
MKLQHLIVGCLALTSTALMAGPFDMLNSALKQVQQPTAPKQEAQPQTLAQTDSAQPASLILTEQPAVSFENTSSQKIPPDGIAFLTVNVESPHNPMGSVSYQWYGGQSGDTSNPIPGASDNQRLRVKPGTSSGVADVTYKTAPVKIGTTSSYWVRITGTQSGATADSKAITVSATAYPPPTITIQPASVTVNQMETATLNVDATGATAISLQWYQGESGDTSKPILHDGTYTALNLQDLTSTTSYWVRAKDAYASADSVTATVTVQDLPQYIKDLNAKTSHGIFKLGETLTKYQDLNPSPLTPKRMDRNDKAAVIIERGMYDVKSLGLKYGNLVINKVVLSSVAGIVVSVDLLLDPVNMEDKEAVIASKKDRNDLERGLLSKYGRPHGDTIEDDYENSIMGDAFPENLVFGVIPRTKAEKLRDVTLIFASVDPVFSTNKSVVASVSIESSKVTDDAIKKFDADLEKANKDAAKKAESMKDNL